MNLLDKKAKEILLRSARCAITTALAQTSVENTRTEPAPAGLKEARGCFVTLTRRGRLRGCIGNIEPVLPLLDAVQRNARNAAFHDPRFSPVTAEDLKQIEIEISVLTAPQRLEFSDPQDLKSKLLPGKHGVIIHCAGKSAVFLPQVWKQLPGKEQFLENLCLKCGLPANAWQQTGMEVSVYEAEYFSENDS